MDRGRPAGRGGIQFFLCPLKRNYTQHISDCDPKRYGPHTQGRAADWEKPFRCDGTRREDDRQNREKWLCQFGMGNAKKAVSWKVKLPGTKGLHDGGGHLLEVLPGARRAQRRLEG